MPYRLGDDGGETKRGAKRNWDEGPEGDEGRELPQSDGRWDIGETGGDVGGGDVMDLGLAPDPELGLRIGVAA